MRKKIIIISSIFVVIFVALITTVIILTKDKESNSSQTTDEAYEMDNIYLSGRPIAKCQDGTYASMTMKEAQKVWEGGGDFVILDVRRIDEFNSGHIPGAINYPNEDIFDGALGLPDKDRVIFVYCRSGRRSKEASKKLYDMGYTRIIECGGITDYEGEKEK